MNEVLNESTLRIQGFPRYVYKHISLMGYHHPEPPKYILPFW